MKNPFGGKALPSPPGTVSGTLRSIAISLDSIALTLQIIVEKQYGVSVEQYSAVERGKDGSDKAFVRYPDRKEAADREWTTALAETLAPDLADRLRELTQLSRDPENEEDAESLAHELEGVLAAAEERVKDDPEAVPVYEIIQPPD